MPLVVISVLFGLSLLAAWVLFRVLQSHLQLVKPPVELLWRETQNVDKLGSIRGTPETFIQIIVIVEKDSTGAVSEPVGVPCR